MTWESQVRGTQNQAGSPAASPAFPLTSALPLPALPLSALPPSRPQLKIDSKRGNPNVEEPDWNRFYQKPPIMLRYWDGNLTPSIDCKIW